MDPDQEHPPSEREIHSATARLLLTGVGAVATVAIVIDFASYLIREGDLTGYEIGDTAQVLILVALAISLALFLLTVVVLGVMWTSERIDDWRLDRRYRNR